MTEGTVVGITDKATTKSGEKCGTATTLCDWDAARTFLRLLDEDADKFTIQTISDRKALIRYEEYYPGVAPGDVRPRGVRAKKRRIDPHAKIRTAALTDGLCEKLERANLDGAGIFFTVNETDLAGRTESNIKRPRAVWADCDNGLPKAFPLPPSAVVETSPGKFHVYWFLGEEMSTEVWRGVMRCLARNHGGDPNAIDLARVLRLPGTFHMKSESPHLVTAVYGESVYRTATLVAAFPPVELVTRASASALAYKPGDTNIDHLVSALAALAHSPSEDDPRQTIVECRATWFKVACAVNRECGDAGLPIWLDWSKLAGRDVYDEDVALDVWSSIDVERYSGQPCTVKTIFHWAKQAGWSQSNERLRQSLATIAAGNEEAKEQAAADDQPSTPVVVAPISWPATNKRNEQGQEIGTPIARAPRNIVYYLEKRGIDVLFNEFDLQTYVRRNGKEEALSDAVISDIYIELNDAGCLSSKDLVADVIRKVGRGKTVHPVRRYLNSLEWDGTPRLEKLLPYYASAADTSLNRAMGRAWMIGAVRRARHPGVKMDAMLVLQGLQGAGKSSFFRTLASSEWFSDSLELGTNAKEFIENSAGVWIFEHPELSGYSKRERNDIKRYIATQSDKARVAFARTAEAVPRQCVFGSTTNDAQFLDDETGNRRFWVVAVGAIRLEELTRDRDKLWAEAAFLEGKEKEHNIPPELWGEAAKTNKQFDVVDPVAERTAEILSELGKNAIISSADLCMALNITDVTRRGGAVGRSINKGARECGWLSDRTNSQRFFHSPDVDDKELAARFTWSTTSGSLVGKKPKRV